MGQKVHPLGFRLGIHEPWRSRWFATKTYGLELLEDIKIRKFLTNRLKGAEVSRIDIDKAGENIRVTVHTGRPGVVIGKKGQSIDNLRNELYAQFKKNIDVSVQEIKSQDTDASIIAQAIADQLSRRASYKRMMKKYGYAAMKAGAKGIKICCSGRLAGAEIARVEWLRLGSVPLHTIRANISYSACDSDTTYGKIGVKVWVCKGEY